MLSLGQISQFYMNFYHTEVHRNWKSLGKKIYHVESVDNQSIILNEESRGVHFHSLKRFCLEFTPLHLYMSVLNFLFTENSEKSKYKTAIPVDGEYVVNIDSYLCKETHRHTTEVEGVCLGCLVQTKNQTQSLLDRIEDHYGDIHIVFNGKSGFNIHVLDFNVRDWTHYSIDYPRNSYETARHKFSKQLQKASPPVYDRQSFTSSTNIQGVTSFPDSLNGETGLICRYLGTPEDFREMEVEDIILKAKSNKYPATPFNRAPTTNWRKPPYILPLAQP